MIRVKVELMPGLGRERREPKFELDLADGSNMKSMLAKIGFKEDEVDHLRVFVNEKLVSSSKVLKDGDEVWVGIIIGGGLVGISLSS